MIELEGVAFGWPHAPAAFAGLNCRIGPGEKVVLLGPNGSGKSTLLKLLDGLVFATAGRCLYDGVELTPRQFRDKAWSRCFRQEVGLLFQDPEAMLFNPTVREEIAYGPRQLGLPDVEARVAHWARELQLEPLLGHAPFNLSGGQKQKVALAAVLAVAPSLRTVVGLDYSPRMLALFQQNAQAQGVPGARAILRSWTDDWADVPECDVVVASRSTAVMDMEQALGKLHDKARRRVYLSSLVGGRFSDVTLQAAIGRPVPPALPDYIYIINILHAQGIQARVDFIAAGAPRAVYRRFEDLLAQVQAREGEITEAEQARLRDWFSAHASTKPAPSASWAMVSWEK